LAPWRGAMLCRGAMLICSRCSAIASLLFSTAQSATSLISAGLAWMCWRTHARNWRVCKRKGVPFSSVRRPKGSVSSGVPEHPNRFLKVWERPWAEGRILEDRHSANVSGLVSPGHHQLRIVVGMYLLETMERLPVFDADGTRVRHDEIVILHDLQIVSESRIYIPLVEKR
jgi:hypothetical protein